MLKRKCDILVVLLTLLAPAFALGQEKLLFTNGKYKDGTVLYKDNNRVYIGVKPRKSVDENKIKAIEEKYKNKRETAQKKYDELIIANPSKTTDLSVSRAAALDLVKKDEVNALAHVRYKGLKRIRLERVFSVIHADGHEEVLYSPDTLGFLVLDAVEPELDYTVAEMRRYIAGCQDGMKVKKTTVLLVSAGVSLVAGGGMGAFYGPIAPSIYMIVVGASKQKPNPRLVSHPEYIQDEAYLEGYKKAARKRKIIAAAEGGLAGLAVGIVAYQTAFRGWK